VFILIVTALMISAFATVASAAVAVVEVVPDFL
jgi:hypothetical protein